MAPAMYAGYIGTCWRGSCSGASVLTAYSGVTMVLASPSSSGCWSSRADSSSNPALQHKSIDDPHSPRPTCRSVSPLLAASHGGFDCAPSTWTVLAADIDDDMASAAASAEQRDLQDCRYGQRRIPSLISGTRSLALEQARREKDPFAQRLDGTVVQSKAPASPA